MCASVLAAEAGDDPLAAGQRRWDEDRSRLWTGLANVQRRCLFLPRDLLGRACSDIAQRVILPGTSLAALDAQRAAVDAAARRGGSAAGQSLATARASLDVALGQVQRFLAFGRETEALDYHRLLWRRTLARVVDSARAPSEALIEKAEARYRERLRDDAYPTSGSNDWRPLLEAYQGERSRLAADLPPTSAAFPQAARGSTPCGPAPPPRGGEQPLALRPGSDPEPYYPEAERLYYVTGLVYVKVSVDAGGCVQSAVVDQSSGADALDVAAVTFAMHSGFQPAENGIGPVAAVARLPVRFALRALPPMPAAH